MSPARLHSIIKLRSDSRMLILLTIIFCAFSIWLMAASQLWLYETTSDIELALGIAILVGTAIFFASPIVLGHILTSRKLIIRYGVLHRMEISLMSIGEVEELNHGPRLPLLLGIGVKYSPFDKRFEILRSTNGVVRLGLTEEMKVGIIPPRKRVKEILIDTIDSEKLIGAIRPPQRRV